MLARRIIPCLDIKEGRVVKGVNFLGLRDAGDPVELAARYDAQGADELVFLDITASSDKRSLIFELASRVAEQVFIPFTVGGGISSVEDVALLLQNGADKISVNTAAFKNPKSKNGLCPTRIAREQLVSRTALRTGSNTFCSASDSCTAMRNGW